MKVGVSKLSKKLEKAGSVFFKKAGRIAPRDVIFFSPKKEKQKAITSHDVLEPSKQALLASRDVIISHLICGSKLQRVSHEVTDAGCPNTLHGRLGQGFGAVSTQGSRHHPKS